ncbi:RusA family crossover junction endodeoxyribonuclease [Methylobacterium oryzisoli]|uniref:RusA family crossover junction endodeoxyribonuclease n=1 Tax=Methylobacterium oryzisoli TaxID=3385502 RepID=UPI003892C403
MSIQGAFYPLEFFVAATPRSLQASSRSRERWKTIVRDAARDRIHETDGLGFLDDRPVSLTIHYFPDAAMQGDIDNIVKPIMDALIHVAYMTDRVVERVLAQKFEPEADWTIADPGAQLLAALATARPVVYVRVDDDLSWRRL